MFLTRVEILDSGPFCAIVQFFDGPQIRLIAPTNFCPESFFFFFMGFKMTGSISLVGTEHIFSVLKLIVFEIFPKNEI